jgi:cytochrome P450
MKDWFGADSLLLEDNDLHIAHKSAWKAQLAPLPSDIEPDLRSTTRAFIAREFQPGNRIDLYEMMKTLAWELLLGAFLGFDTEGAGSEGFHAKVESLQETLLRGQFSLLPLSISTPFYQSPRSRGLRARAQLQDLLSKHIQQQTPGRCPLLRKTEVGEEDVARHALLFTSSIANKALASLMVASVMNVFLREGGELVGGLKGEGARDGMVLRSLLRETERLSPPVVGVMRRTNGEVVLQGGGEMEREGHAVG